MMEPLICYICNDASVFYSRNLFKTKSKYSETQICEMIRNLLCNFPSEREYDSIRCDNSDYCICIQCLDKIDEYDLAITTAKRIETELRDLLLHSETIFKHNSKMNLPEELLPIEIVDTFENQTNDDNFESNEEIDPNDRISENECENEDLDSNNEFNSLNLTNEYEQKLTNQINQCKYKCCECNCEFKRYIDFFDIFLQLLIICRF